MSDSGILLMLLIWIILSCLPLSLGLIVSAVLAIVCMTTMLIMKKNEPK